ncbi:hypothetical protein BZL30_4881 [Mycobacterium kansasii]|uniref:Uncharacterized protein n=1 Tax=Mycobacterium kansasii TaxID=1768 RepID=A0A1V3X3J5_MYCKA|nr:hypothetical protein BZL30_4881 [Mycobacterium kansasii]OOK77457.1 hypothetical protein BZL29_3883 [Mycobacterium kansasii]
MPVDSDIDAATKAAAVADLMRGFAMRVMSGISAAVAKALPPRKTYEIG